MNENVLQTIRSGMDGFSKGQKRIAAFILDNYDRAAFMTAARLGETASVSESTVVRFAAQLGYDGYPEMQKALQELIRGKLTSIQRIQVSRDQMSGADEGSAGRLRAVTSLDGQPIAPAQVDELYRRGDRAEYRIVIHQGKKRQIRRMCAAVGLTVTRLCRVAEGGLELGALPPGRWRYLTAGELESIKGSD